MTKKLIIPLLLLLLLPLPSTALQQQSLYLSLKNDTTKCVDIVLPDDLGVLEAGIRGTKEYMLSTTAGDWADLTLQIVRTDENNTVLIPICFSTIGKVQGECSEDFSINIASAEINKSKTWQGGVCVSRFEDIDTGAKPPSQTVQEALNEKKDFFAITFKKDTIYAKPGERVQFTLLFNSYADIETDIRIDSFAQLEPRFVTLKTDRSNPRREINITAAGMGMNEYVLDVTAKIKYCLGSYCEKKTSGKLITAESVPETSGFTVRLFPENINIKYLDPVLYELVIKNADKTADYGAALSVPAGMETDFKPKTISLKPDEEISLFFTVMPKEVSRVYEIKATVKSGNATKQAVSYLSTNEVLTDAMREFETTVFNDSGKANAELALNRFMDEYKKSGYGNDIGSYTAYRATVNASRAAVVPAKPPNQTGAYQPVRQVDITFFIVVAVIAAGAVFAVYFFLRHRKEEENIIS